MANLVDKVATSNLWLTPENALKCVRDYCREDTKSDQIGLDPCTQPDNPTNAVKFFTEADNGLNQPWENNGVVFVNPPYSLTPDDKAAGVREPPIRPWARKIREEATKGVTILALLPCGARFSTKYWQDNILIPELIAVCFVRGRLKFIDANTGKPGKYNNYDSMFYGYNTDPDWFFSSFRSLGRVASTYLSSDGNYVQ